MGFNSSRYVQDKLEMGCFTLTQRPGGELHRFWPKSGAVTDTTAMDGCESEWQDGKVQPRVTVIVCMCKKQQSLQEKS